MNNLVDRRVSADYHDAGWQKLEKLIAIVEKLPPGSYNQNMPISGGKPGGLQLCAIGNAYRVGLTESVNHSDGARVFGIPVATAVRLFGSSDSVNRLLGRPTWRRVKPTDWAKAAKAVLAEQRVLRGVGA